MTSRSLDPYGALGIDRKATPLQIKSSYRTLMRRIHPDYASGLYADDNPDSTKNRDYFQAVQDAYELLSDEARRAEYDRTVSPPVSIPIQSQTAASERIPPPRSTPSVGTPRFEQPARDPVIFIELTPNQCLKGGEVEIETGHLPLVLPFPAGIPNGYEIETSLGTVVLHYGNTPMSWIVGRDLYRRFPVQPEQITAGSVLIVKVGARQFQIDLDPVHPFKEFVFPGAGLPVLGDLPAGNLHLLPSHK